MPRTTNQDRYSLSGEVRQAVIADSSNFIAQTDTSRIMQTPQNQRLSFADKRGRNGGFTLFHNDLDEVIALLMRYRSLMPDTPPETVEDSTDDQVADPGF